MSHYDDDVRCRKCGKVYDSVRASEGGTERAQHGIRLVLEGRVCDKCRPRPKPGKRDKTIAIDFDGTCVYHEYPETGADVPGAVTVLRELSAAGHRLILYTMRSGVHLDRAVRWFAQRNIPLADVNNNRAQASWTTSPKVHANLYIDDAALGCPLLTDIQHARYYVDWTEVRRLLGIRGYLPLKETP